MNHEPVIDQDRDPVLTANLLHLPVAAHWTYSSAPTADGDPRRHLDLPTLQPGSTS
jgi:hypothetical protein